MGRQAIIERVISGSERASRSQVHNLVGPIYFEDEAGVAAKPGA